MNPKEITKADEHWFGEHPFADCYVRPTYPGELEYLRANGNKSKLDALRSFAPPAGLVLRLSVFLGHLQPGVIVRLPVLANETFTKVFFVTEIGVVEGQVQAVVNQIRTNLALGKSKVDKCDDCEEPFRSEDIRVTYDKINVCEKCSSARMILGQTFTKRGVYITAVDLKNKDVQRRVKKKLAMLQKGSN